MARRILVVEDNADFQELLAMSATSWGHEVDTASDGKEGLERILQSSPDLALVDIGLPGLDGHEVARRVRADPRGAKVALVALTGYGSREQRAEALQSGFDCVLVKPVEPALLQKVLSSESRDQLSKL
ncbi:MAG TPA: response regulator [Polyangiales bacterium]